MEGGENAYPRWSKDGKRAQLSPDGSAIAFNRQDGKTITIYVLELRS
jgi:Tol biopolymer transport system component